MEPRTYRITVRGRVSERFARALGPLAVERRGGDTVLVSDAVDQAQLYGLINRLRDLGVELVSLEEAS